MARKERTEGELTGAYEHLGYELDMLRETADALHSGRFPPSPLRNAIWESFIIHARNLLHFLDPAGARDSDVLADDFLPEPEEWHRVRGELPAELADVRARANKEMAHLTYERLSLTDESKTWNYGAIALAIAERFSRFGELHERSVAKSRAPANPRYPPTTEEATMSDRRSIPIDGRDVAFHIARPDALALSSPPRGQSLEEHIIATTAERAISIKEVPPGTSIDQFSDEELEQLYRAAAAPAIKVARTPNPDGTWIINHTIVHIGSGGNMKSVQIPGPDRTFASEEEAVAAATRDAERRIAQGGI